jgi:hypothetical protein
MMLRQAQTVLGGGNAKNTAQLSFPDIPGMPSVTCTHSRIDDNWAIGHGNAGRSSLLMIERCEFLVEDVPQKYRHKMTKGAKCVLTVSAAIAPLELQLWAGGSMPGATVYRFQLADRNFAV